jgi:hypothetical protein
LDSSSGFSNLDNGYTLDNSSSGLKSRSGFVALDNSSVDYGSSGGCGGYWIAAGKAASLAMAWIVAAASLPWIIAALTKEAAADVADIGYGFVTFVGFVRR